MKKKTFIPPYGRMEKKHLNKTVKINAESIILAAAQNKVFIDLGVFKGGQP